MTPKELKSLREAAKLTQQQFADALGINRVTLADMERGSAPIERRTIAAVEGMMRYRIDVCHTPALSGARPWTVTVTGPGRSPVHRRHDVLGAWASEEAARTAAETFRRDRIPLARIQIHGPQ